MRSLDALVVAGAVWADDASLCAAAVLVAAGVEPHALIPSTNTATKRTTRNFFIHIPPNKIKNPPDDGLSREGPISLVQLKL